MYVPFFNRFLYATFTTYVVLLHSFHGNRGYTTGEHVNRNDG